MRWANYFYWSKSQRRGLLLLISCIFLLFLVITLSYFTKEPNLEIIKNEDFLAYNSFIHSIHKQRKKVFYKKRKKQKIHLFYFDPNKADSLQFIRLGLQGYIIHNILQYRRNKGVFRSPYSFSRIYGLKKTKFLKLLPYLKIEKKSFYKKHSFKNKDTLVYPSKYTTYIKIELNKADTITLKKIPGIGSGIAKMILSYRKKLGGYSQVKQLKEINYVADSLLKWFVVCIPPKRLLFINKFSLEHLRSHPYLNFYQAKVIINYRKKYGPLKTLKSLSLYEEFNKTDFKRLRPYVNFESY